MNLCICLFVFVTHVIHVVSKVQFQIVRCSWWQCCNSRCQIPLQFWARVRSDSQFRVRTNPRFPTSDCRSRLCQDCLVIGRRVGRVWGDNYKSRVKSRIWTAFLSSWLSWSWQKSWYSWYKHVTKGGVPGPDAPKMQALPEWGGAMPMSLGNSFSQDVPIGCPGTSSMDVLGHPYVMSWDISMWHSRWLLNHNRS